MTISVVVPCFNEEESIPLFYQAMERVRMEMGEKFLFLEISEKKQHSMLDLSVLMVNSSQLWM